MHSLRGFKIISKEEHLPLRFEIVVLKLTFRFCQYFCLRLDVGAVGTV